MSILEKPDFDPRVKTCRQGMTMTSVASQTSLAACGVQLPKWRPMRVLTSHPAILDAPSN
jgi:hypothetical protein